MARQVTLEQLVTRVRQRANIENSQFVTDIELTSYINESLCELYDLLVASYGQEYFRTSTTFSTTGGVVDYALPTDFYKLISVDVDLGGPCVYSALAYMESERNLYNSFPGWSYGSPIAYRLHGMNSTFAYGSIGFIPQPSGTYSITLNYVPACTDLYRPDDTFDGVSGWEEYVVVDAAIKCLQKEESDVSVLFAQKQALIARIAAMAPSRDAQSPERARDVHIDPGPYRSRRWF